MNNSKYRIKEVVDFKVIDKETGKVLYEATSKAIEYMNEDLKKKVDETKNA